MDLENHSKKLDPKTFKQLKLKSIEKAISYFNL